MALFDKKQKAITLRKKGMSISEIVSALSVSKSSVLRWCENIALSKKQISQLEKRTSDAQLRGRMIGAAINKQRKQDSIASAELRARKIVGKLSKRELVLISTALYWAEGSKADSSSGFQFINSDPKMILFVVEALRDFGVANEDIYCTIQINEMHRYRIGKVLNFWQKLLGLKSSQMRTPSFVKTQVKKQYENHDVYFGICRLRVRRSTVLKYTFLGLIKAIKEDIDMPV